ncbi:3'-5' exonuclease [Roseateles sp. GG27B]
MTPPVLLDIEASGFGRGSYPIEIGFIGPEGRAFCALIKPEPDWLHWDASAEALHGISRELLQRCGKAPLWVATEINACLAGQIVYCDAWGYDYPWLSRLFDAVGLVPSFRLADLRSLLTEDDQAYWQAALEQVRAELQLRRHRASSDAKVLQLTLMRVKQQVVAAGLPAVLRV